LEKDTTDAFVGFRAGKKKAISPIKVEKKRAVKIQNRFERRGVNNTMAKFGGSLFPKKKNYTRGIWCASLRLQKKLGKARSVSLRNNGDPRKFKGGKCAPGELALGVGDRRVFKRVIKGKTCDLYHELLAPEKKKKKKPPWY